MVWLSFSDPTKPKGFLGVVIVEVSQCRQCPIGHRATMSLAIAAAGKLNPGGEVRGYVIPPDDEERYKGYMGRLLSRHDMARIGTHVTAGLEPRRYL